MGIVSVTCKKVGERRNGDKGSDWDDDKELGRVSWRAR